MTEETFALLAQALALDGARVSVRGAGAIAELVGPLEARRGAAGADEWLTLGAEGGSHVHLKAADLAGLRFSAPLDGNAALEVVNGDGARVCRVSFGRTNRGKPDALDGARLAEVTRRFGQLAEPSSSSSSSPPVPPPPPEDA